MSINVLHDSRNELYRMPGGAMPAGGRVRMRFWASRPFKRVFLRIWTDAEQRIPMRALGVYSGGIMYEAELLLPSKPGLCWYCFLLKDGGRDYWYGNAADHLGGVGEVYDYQPPSYQITVYDPAFMPPEWLRGGAMYQIFPDRFFRTDIGPRGRLPLPAGTAWRSARRAGGPASGSEAADCASDCNACAQAVCGAESASAQPGEVRDVEGVASACTGPDGGVEADARKTCSVMPAQADTARGTAGHGPDSASGRGNAAGSAEGAAGDAPDAAKSAASVKPNGTEYGRVSSTSSCATEGAASSATSSLTEGAANGVASSVTEGTATGAASSVTEGAASSAASFAIEGAASSAASSATEGAANGAASSAANNATEGTASSAAFELPGSGAARVVAGGEPVLAPFERVRPMMHGNWYEKPVLDISANGDNSARDFFGGTLRGITAKLDYLQWLGVTVIYLNPIFLSPSNHRYNCSDYLRIDPRLGDESDLRRLCAEAGRRGMRIMLDGVFSHTGDDSVYFNRYGTFANAGACQGESSPYYGWYTFEHFPDKYKCWWGFDTLPEVNKDSRSFKRFICGPEPDGSDAARDGADEQADAQSMRCPEGVARHYLRLGVSGWRLDVADELPMDFLAALRRAVHAEKSDAAILGEVWEDASNKEAYGQVRCYFKGDTLDSVMNYPLRDMAIDFMLGRITGNDFARRYLALAENYPRPALYALMNLMGSHDRPRIMNLMAGMDPNMPREQQAQAAIPAYACGLAARRVTALWRLICAMPGVPCVYYGDEAGARGMGDPFNRGTYPWGYEDTRLYTYIYSALEVRRDSEALRRGYVDVFAPCDDVVAVVRRLPEGCDYAGQPSHEENFMAIINRSMSAVTVCLDACGLPRFEGLQRDGDMYVVELPALTTGYFTGA